MSTDKKITVLVADDHPIVRSGVAAMVDGHSEMQLLAQAADGNEAVRLYQAHRPNVVLMDLRMPGLDGVEAILAIKAIEPEARIVILTTFDGEEDIYRGLRAGAKAYLLKDSPHDEIADCIRAVARGQKYLPPHIATKLLERLDNDTLSKRELEVLGLMATGKSNKEIARETSITEGTVKFHVSAIMAKLDAKSRTEAVAVAAKRRLIALE
jgi:two-component system, NarL family, response regulator